MAVRSLLVVASLILAVPGLGAASEEVASASEPLGCGALAPFDTSCQDCCETYRGGSPKVELNALGYVGGLLVRLRGDDGSMYWSCWVLGSEVLSGCVTYTTGAGLKRGEDVRLFCYATPTKGPGLPVSVGPLGAWGCVVHP